MEENKKFNYTYSANQQAEIEKIRKKYIPQEEDKMEKLRRLDRSAEQKGTMYSIIIGVISTLVMGLGMSCVMEWQMFVVGIIIGAIGIIGIASSFPLYMYITKKQRERIAPEILRLTEELSHSK